MDAIEIGKARIAAGAVGQARPRAGSGSSLRPGMGAAKAFSAGFDDNPLKSHNSRKEKDLEFLPKNLDFVPSDLDFVPPGLDFVPPDLEILPCGLECPPRPGLSAPGESGVEADGAKLQVLAPNALKTLARLQSARARAAPPALAPRSRAQRGLSIACPAPAEGGVGAGPFVPTYERPLPFPAAASCCLSWGLGPRGLVGR